MTTIHRFPAFLNCNSDSMIYTNNTDIGEMFCNPNAFVLQPFCLSGDRGNKKTILNQNVTNLWCYLINFKPNLTLYILIEYAAEALHLPLLSPYLKVADGQINIPGVNFAVAGASALDTNFFKGLPVTTNISLNVQLSWFKKWKSSFCANRQDCERYLNKSLFVVREIGGNDYNNGLFVGQGIENGKALVRTVVEDNTNATINLIEEGAVDLMVSGNLPIGCMLMFLTMFGSSNQSNYGKSTGCLKTFNALARYHNKKLRQSLEELRSKYPNSKIMYADYYRAAMKLYKDPKQHGESSSAT
ncbi:GDSL esterase/lipase At5g45910-like [Punica granatum]|uniref:GDSL esterase/lipase At5g45910-like n=1 Tax=Punica granatum TaxID=22663 RepID=A0A6P8E154_PUNGR|nr:GDSL esterase/lipase At5g45910-like [Punica granatum]